MSRRCANRAWAAQSSSEADMLQDDQPDTLLGEMLSAEGYVSHPEGDLRQRRQVGRPRHSERLSAAR